MSRDKDLAEIMDAIYFAAHQRDGWQHCLDRISVLSGGQSAQLLMLDKENHQRMGCYQSPRSLAESRNHGGQALTLCDVRHDAGDALLVLTVQRPAEQGGFGGAEKELIEGLMPHIARALRQEEAARLIDDRQMAVYRQKQGAMLLLDGQRDVVFVSTEAEKQLMETASVRLEASRLRVFRRQSQAELDTLIQECLTRKYTGMVNIGDAGKESMRLLVSTVQHRDEALFLSHGLLAIFIVADPGEGNSEEELIGQWLGLTESESRIANGIARGQKPRQIADQLSLSVHTVRHHIKNIYRKTGAHSQSQLTALVLNLPV
ncbi:MAG TPA: hypothetical protein DC022_12740 [Alcanivorax sp.]|nr:hypothetical protein [Alcanivorax sp.]